MTDEAKNARKNNSKGLGKGLGALLQNTHLDLGDEEQLKEIDIHDISPNPKQPRRYFDEEALNELASSIKENGLIQPIIVSQDKNGGYTIIAGERRWRAAMRADLESIPVIIRDLDEEERLKQALIENIQRENLNPIESSDAMMLLMSEHQLTQEELADKLGKSRSAIANTLRLQKLPLALRDMLLRGDITEGHARALLSLQNEEDQLEAADRILLKGLSVRQTEALVQTYLQKNKKESAEPEKELSAEKMQEMLSIRSVEKRISKKLGVKVSLKDRGGKGYIKVPYKNLDELDRLLEALE